MDTTKGVPLNELHCPTCGNRFTDYKLYTDSEEEFCISQTVKEIMVVAAYWRRFLRCPNGHRWTIKTVWRAHGNPQLPDLVLLGRFIGT